MAGSGAGLVHIDDELVAMLAGEDLVGGPDDGVGELGFEPAGLLVSERGGVLDPDDCIDEGGEWPKPGDGKVFRGAESLNTVERLRGDGFLAERVLFDPSGHGVGK